MKKNLEDHQQEMKERIEIEEEKNTYEEINSKKYKDNIIIKDFIKNKLDTIKFNKKQIIVLKKTLVYIYWKYIDRDYKIAIYIGQSSIGIGRPLADSHHKSIQCSIADELEIFPCNSNLESIVIENELIKFLRPQCNYRSKKLPRKIPFINFYELMEQFI